MNVKTFEEELKNLQLARKNGNITAGDFYVSLLKLILKMEKLNNSGLEDDKNLRKKISFLLLFLETTFKKSSF
jgi:hypothetical protein